MAEADFDIREIRELAKKFSTSQIEECIRMQISEGANPCAVSDGAEQIMNHLAKAQFVRTRMEEGMSLMEAVRELARRIREVQKYGEGEGSKG